MSASHERPDAGNTSERRSEAANWAPLIDKLRVSGVPEGALNLNVEGRRVVGPLQGFGKLWQKTYRVRLSSAKVTPAEVVTFWKENLPRLMPQHSRFYPSLRGIQPGEVVFIKGSAGPMKLATGVMVLYADDESFTLMTPQGHMLAGWVTFSAFEEKGCTVAQAQELIRAQDPLSEIGLAVFGRMADEFWPQTLRSLAAHFDVAGQVQMHKTCVDPKLQWSEAKNIWYNAAIRSMLYGLAAPARWVAKPFKGRKR